MHDTAFSIGCLVLNKYCTLADADILEVGAFNVNGTLRKHALSTTRYIGVDFDLGPGVDVVISPGEPYPLPDESFDLVLASSVLEHDSMFWVTFLEMCRKARKGGHIYINAPANGSVHRYPEDNWRFYPDSGRSLARWAQSQGQDVVLVESFTADRVSDHWNDFCAVFRKGPSDTPMPDDFIHQHLSCSNILTWKSDEMGNARAETQDMLLLKESEERRHNLEQQIGHIEFALLAEKERSEETLTRVVMIGQQLEDAQCELENARSRSDTLEGELNSNLAMLTIHKATLEAEAEQLRQTLAQREMNGEARAKEYDALEQQYATTLSTLRQREEEIAQTRNELEHLRGTVKEQDAQLAASTEKLAEASEALHRTEGRLQSADAWVFKLAGERQAAQMEVATLQREATNLRNRLASAISRSDRLADSQSAANKAKATMAQRLRDLTSEIESLKYQLLSAEDELARQPVENNVQPDDRIGHLEAEIGRWHALMERERTQASKLEGARREIDDLRTALAMAQTALEQAEHDRAASEEQVNIVKADLEKTNKLARLAVSQRTQAFSEMAVITKLLRDSEQDMLRVNDNIHWLRQIYTIILRRPKWWLLLSRKKQIERLRRRVERRGLFDSNSYLEKNPDVAATGVDPLKHYMTHGIIEYRSR